MIIDGKKYAGPCSCSQEHSVTTQRAIIESGCMKAFDDHLAQAGLTGRRAAIYDTNTYGAKGLSRPGAELEIVLAADGLQADDGAVATVLQQLSGDTDILVAIGGGTIHDIVRYCANKLNLPFVSCPTAASVDGFASNRCSMHWRGKQVIMPSVAPVLVLADLDVIRQAPTYLMRAGVGEAISKFTSLADFRIASVLTNTPVCPAIEAMLRQAAIAAQGACAILSRGEPGAYAQLMYALLLCGFASQMQDEGEPASAAEHHMAFLMDLLPDQYGAKEPVVHGEQVGICTTVIADLYHRLAEIDDITPYVKALKPLEEAQLRKSFGDELGEQLAGENEPDCLLSVDRQKLIDEWETIRRIIAEVPDKTALMAMLSAIDAKTTMKDLSISDTKIPRMLQLAPCIRNQITLTRMLRMLKFRYASSTDASRAPSRKSRYADKAMKRAGSNSPVSASSMR